MTYLRQRVSLAVYKFYTAMARKVFKYDVMQLIEAVRDRPCLWDKTNEGYKDRVERKDAWVEVFRLLDPSFDKLDKEEQRLTGECIMTKWINMRDTFVKTLRTKPGKPKRRYMLHKQLIFLLKGQPHEEANDYAEVAALNEEDYTPQYLKTEETESSEDERKDTESESYKREESTDDSFKRKKNEDGYKKKRRRRMTTIEEPEISGIDVYNDPRVMNEDEAFFASLLPSVVNYSEDERLEFRLEVLALMKRIKQKRNDPIY